MESLLIQYREENKNLQRQVNDYQTFSLEMIRLFHNRVQEKILNEDLPDFMKDLYAESPTYLRMIALKVCLKHFVDVIFRFRKKENT